LHATAESRAGNWRLVALTDASGMVARLRSGQTKGSGMRKARGQTTRSEKPIEMPESTSLLQEVKQALLRVLRDDSASAAAKASAGRTLLEYFSDESASASKRRGAELTAAELDAEISKLES